MQDLQQAWRLKPAVEALMAFKGFQTVAAMITISELGSLPRFGHPRQLMGYLGLVPSESSSGEGRRQGGITKCGNPHARWLLIECSQHYAMPPKVSKELSKRQEGQPASVVKVSWEAQHRLHRRLMRLLARRVHRNKAMVAVARELVAFIWEALRELPCYQEDEASTQVSHA
jgi:transposase